MAKDKKNVELPVEDTKVELTPEQETGLSVEEQAEMLELLAGKVTADGMKRVKELVAKKQKALANAEKFAKQKAAEAEGEAKLKVELQQHKIEVNEKVTDFANNLAGVEFTSAENVRETFSEFLKTLPKTPKAGKVIRTRREGSANGTGVIATICKCITDSKESGVSKKEIVEHLIITFPDRGEDSMKTTVNSQVPGRIHNEKFELEKLENGNYRRVNAE